MRHRYRTSAPVAVVKIDDVNAEISALGNVEFGAAYKLGRSSGFDKIDVGGEFSP